MHALRVEPIFEAVLANDPSRIAAGTSAAAAQRMDEDLFVAELPHWLYRGDTPLQTLEQVVGREPLSPRRLDARVPRELETICLKCLEKEPGKRYAGALGMKAELHV